MVVRLTINGEDRQIGGPLSVCDLLASLGMDPTKIAVERNLEIVPRSQYGAVVVGEGDRLEIVHFIGGGNDAPVDKPLVIAGKTYRSRLISVSRIRSRPCASTGCTVRQTLVASDTTRTTECRTIREMGGITRSKGLQNAKAWTLLRPAP